jgi:hypothetical protein
VKQGSISLLQPSPKLELGARNQEERVRRKKEEEKTQKKCFYKYEMLPETVLV